MIHHLAHALACWLCVVTVWSSVLLLAVFELLLLYYDYYYYYCYDVVVVAAAAVVSCHRPFFPGTSPEPTAISTVQASSSRLQYFPYYV
jgi:hypothetical protein